MGWLNGIDSVAHLYSYNQLGKTIAVLGNGFNHIFPEENIGLYKKILDNDGLIISEYPPDTKCKSDYFLERNRIVSGLALGILVIEAVYRSGTSVTAKLAISQNRKLFALPHEIWNSHGIGTNRLLKNGAVLVTQTEDILQEIKILRKFIKKLELIQKIDLSSLDVDYNIFDNAKHSNSTAYLSNKNLSISSNSNDCLNKKKLHNVRLQYIYDLISNEPISIDEICKKTNKPIAVILNDLFLLELEGCIKKVAGGYICILNK